MDAVVQNVTPMYLGEPLLIMSPTSTLVSENGGIGASPPQADVSELKTLLKRQVEYYFSRENLNHDTYLVSQMDSDQYVDISIIASFNQVKRLTDDISLLVEVLKDSLSVQVDETETKVRPLHKRSMVIMREVAEDATRGEIEEILAPKECPPFLTCEPVTGNYWYIDFETEEAAQKAYSYLRDTVQTFKGQPIRVRIKAKPSTLTLPAHRHDQPKIEVPITTTVDSTRALTAPLQSPTTSAIRYPVPLHHIPLQNPQYPFTMPAPTQFSYMPYVIQQPVLQQPWMFAEPNYMNAYEMAPGYTYQPMPSQPRPSQGQGHTTSGYKHTPPNRSAATNTSVSDRSGGDTNATRPLASQSTSVNNTSKNASGSHTGHYSTTNGSRGGSDNSHFSKHSGLSNRNNRGYNDNHTTPDRNFNNSDNVPPRLQKNRLNKDKHRVVGHNNYFGQGSQSQVSSGPTARRSTNHPPHNRPNATTTGNAPLTGHGNLPHQSRGSVAGPPHSSGHESRVDRNGKDYLNKQSNTDLPHAHNRNQGAHRNSKSPEKELDQTQSHDVAKSKSFELDSSAFPALPGATTAASCTATNTISLDSIAVTATDTVVAPATQVVASLGHDSKAAATSIVETDKAVMAESVSKLSDIVKNNIPELSKLADAAKSTKSSHKETSGNSSHSVMPRNHGSSKAQSGRSYQKSRPTHLTNGVNHSEPPSKPGRSVSTASKTTDPIPGKSPDTQSLSRKDSIGDPAIPIGSDSRGTVNAQISPSDSKISYAAIAQRVSALPTMTTATAVTTTAAAKILPTTDQAPVSSLSSAAGDSNNNAESKHAANSKPVDNLYYSAAAKNAPNSSAANISPRKPAVVHSRSASFKPKTGDGKSSPTSPANRNPSGSHSSVVA